MDTTPDDIGRLILEIFRMNGCLLAAGDKLVAPFGLSSARWQVLGAALRSKQRQTVSQIARESGVSRQAVQRIVNALVDDGLLNLAENSKDRRAPLINVTKAGRDAYSKADKARRAWLSSLALKVEKQEIEGAVLLLKRMQQQLINSET